MIYKFQNFIENIKESHRDHVNRENNNIEFYNDQYLTKIGDKYYGYKIEFSKKRILNFYVLKESKILGSLEHDPMGKEKIQYLDVDPYGEEDWENNIVEDIPTYKLPILKNLDLSGNVEYILKHNIMDGYGGCDVPIIYINYYLNSNSIKALHDNNCIGFISNSLGIKFDRPRDYYIPGIYKLVPVYKKEYIWEYNDNFILQHAFETGANIKVFKEDLEKFVKIITNEDPTWSWCAHNDWKRLINNKGEKFFKHDNDFIYIRISSCILPTLSSKEEYIKGEYIVNFKDILNKTAKYYKL